MVKRKFNDKEKKQKKKQHFLPKVTNKCLKTEKYCLQKQNKYIAIIFATCNAHEKKTLNLHKGFF